MKLGYGGGIEKWISGDNLIDLNLRDKNQGGKKEDEEERTMIPRVRWVGYRPRQTARKPPLGRMLPPRTRNPEVASML